MKSSELHKFIRKNGWSLLRVKGSHYIYEKMEEPIQFLIMEPRKWEKE